jgi:hypothetical protein
LQKLSWSSKSFSLFFQQNSGGAQLTTNSCSRAKKLFVVVLVFVFFLSFFFMAFQSEVYAVSDSFEPDNSFIQFSSLILTSSLQSQSRSIDPAGDNDYIRFYASGGTKYSFYTESSLDTEGYLYDSSQILLSSDSDSGTGNNFKIDYTFSSDGNYFLRVKAYSSSTVGAYTLYFGQSPGSLKVYTGITGVSVYVDGVYGGSTDSYSGATVSGVVAGDRTLRLAMSGYKGWTKQINIVSGQTTTIYAYLDIGTGTSITRSETISYSASYGSLKVYTGVTGVSVYIGGEYGGSTDYYSGTTVNGLIVGTYTLKLSMPGYKDWTKQVSIASAQTSTVYAYLESGTGVATTRNETISYNVSYGRLKVYTGNNNVKVYVGGEFGGSTDSYSGVTVNGLVVGNYYLKLSMSGYKDWVKQVNIIAGQTATVYAYLEPGTGTSVTRNETLSYNLALGSLKVNTGVTGVSVYVGGEFGGLTDDYSGATVNGLVAGTYTLKLSMPGYKDWTKQASVTVGKTTTVYAYPENGTGTSVTRDEIAVYDSPYGTLKVNTGITGVSVYVGGEFGGLTDDYSGDTVNGLVAGTYTLKLSMPGYKDWTKQASVTVGKTTTVYAYLELGTGDGLTRSETLAYDSPYGSLTVNTGLNGVSVYVGGEYGGKTDYYSEVTVDGLINGIYTLKLTATGYSELTQQVSITTGQTTTVQATLTTAPSQYVNFAITTLAGPGGTISGRSGSDSSFAYKGQTITVTISPNYGYAISNVIVDGVSQGPIGSCALTDIQSNHEISASFTPISTPTPTITPTKEVTSSPSSTISPSVESQLPSMWPLYLGIGFGGLIFLAGAISITKHVSNRPRSLTIDVDGEGGTTNPSPSVQKYKKGTQATVEAIPNSGWAFDQWSGDASGRQNPVILTMNSHRVVTASFVQMGQNQQAESEQAQRKRADQAERDRKQRQQEYAQQERARQAQRERERKAQQEQERQRGEQERKGKDDWNDNNTLDPYEILHVPRDATAKQVKEAWRELVKKWYPTRAKSEDPSVQELFSREFDKVNKAYEQIKKAKGWT